MRRERRFEEADEIRDEIVQLGVQIWDRDRLWSTSGAPPPRNEYNEADSSARRNNFYRDTQRSAARSVRAQPSYGERVPYSRDDRPRTKSTVRQLNENGHDYTRSPTDVSTGLKEGSASLEAVHELLRERLEAKLAKDFDEADALLAQLERDHGVTVNDGTKEWRADGLSFARRWVRAGPAKAAVDETAVLGLIDERTAARKEQNYRRADALLSELLEVHGVVLVDSEYTWRVVGSAHDGAYGEGGGYGRRAQPNANAGHDYMREPGDVAPIAPETEAQIHRLLATRLAKKKAREFGEADVLQEELWQLGVEVDDRARSWYYVLPGSKGKAAPGAVSGAADLDGPRPSGAEKEWGAW